MGRAKVGRFASRRAEAAGASAYLAKPYGPRDLLALIRKLLPEN